MNDGVALTVQQDVGDEDLPKVEGGAARLRLFADELICWVVVGAEGVLTIAAQDVDVELCDGGGDAVNAGVDRRQAERDIDVHIDAGAGSVAAEV